MTMLLGWDDDVECLVRIELESCHEAVKCFYAKGIARDTKKLALLWNVGRRKGNTFEVHIEGEATLEDALCGGMS